MEIETVGELKKILADIPDDMALHGWSGNGGTFKPYVELQGYMVKVVGPKNDCMIVAQNDPIFEKWKGKTSKVYKSIVVG